MVYGNEERLVGAQREASEGEVGDVYFAEDYIYGTSKFIYVCIVSTKVSRI